MLRLLFICLIGFHSINGLPQNNLNPNDVSQLIAQVFPNTSTNTQTDGTIRAGFGTIVQPEFTVQPTQMPQQMETESGRCTCVTYYLCDPASNTIRTDGQTDGFGQIDVRFDPQGCQHYLDVCCRTGPTSAPPTNPNTPTSAPEPVTVPTTANPPPPVQPSGCGIRNVNGIDFQIVGAENYEAGFGEFPWTVAVIQISNDACLGGGSLIHPKMVLTAAHIVKKSRPDDIKIRAGEWDTQTEKERLPYQERLVDRVVMHDDFNPKTLANDIAMLHLEYEVQLDLHINTICLPPQGEIPVSRNCYASGWGKDEFGKRGKYSVIMKKVKLPIVQNDVCEAELQATRLGNAFRLHRTFICAGGEEGIDTCQGDGGAPLVCPSGKRSDNKYVQNGIVAWGIGCKQNHPAVYAHVAYFRNWIDGVMRSLGLDISSYVV